eukprot:INCI7058.6.p1 GENE.INCI7058.6~~INCI7058.6.p1  ORF type:complete len:116 (-),score=5.42 INCI7058.6:19-366(-)
MHHAKQGRRCSTCHRGTVLNSTRMSASELPTFLRVKRSVRVKRSAVSAPSLTKRMMSLPAPVPPPSPTTSRTVTKSSEPVPRHIHALTDIKALMLFLRVPLPMDLFCSNGRFCCH